MNKILILITLLFIIGCTKKEYIIEVPNKLTLDPKAPENFSLMVSDITDHSANLTWGISLDASGRVSYEISINDSVVAYNLDVNTYKINNLHADTKYMVSVIALDPERNSTTITKEFQTMKFFIKKMIPFGLDYQSFNLSKVIDTSDKGILIGGTLREHITKVYNQAFILKLDEDFEFEWIKIFDSYDYLNNLLESKDGSYIAVLNSSVSKVNDQGIELWNYKNPDVNIFANIKCATEDANGNFIFAGSSCKEISKDVIKSYTLFKLSSAGNELWYKYGGKTQANSPQSILTQNNGHFIVFGTAAYTNVRSGLYGGKECYWLLWCDENGEFIDQKLFPNLLGDGDISEEIVQASDQNYLLLGSAAAYLPPNGYWGLEPRILKVTPKGEVIWEKFLTSGAYDPTFRKYIHINSDMSLIQTNDDRGNIFYFCDGSANFDKQIKLYGYPGYFIFRVDSEGDYYCIDNEGIIIYNHDGYLP